MERRAESTRHEYIVGVIFLLAAAALWSLGGALIKLVHEDGHGVDVAGIAFYRSLFAGLLLLPLARGKFHTLCRNRDRPSGDPASGPGALPESGLRASFPDRPARLGVLEWLFSLRPAAVCCVAFFAAMTICFVLANTKTKAANVIILQYTSTFWVFILSPLLLQEKPRGGDLWMLGLAMIGIAIIFVGNASTDLVGLLIALAAGVGYAVETMMIRRLRDSDSAALIVLNLFGSALVLVPVVALAGCFPTSARSWLLLAFLGVVQFGLPYYLFARALVHVPAYHAALLTLIEPVLVPVWTYLAVKEAIGTTTIVGGSLILVALLAFIWAGRRGLH